MTQGDGALDTGADVEQSVIGGGNDSRLHSGYEAESGKIVMSIVPLGWRRTPQLCCRMSAQLEQSQHPVAVWTADGAAVPSDTEENRRFGGFTG